MIRIKRFYLLNILTYTLAFFPFNAQTSTNEIAGYLCGKMSEDDFMNALLNTSAQDLENAYKALETQPLTQDNPITRRISQAKDLITQALWVKVAEKPDPLSSISPSLVSSFKEIVATNNATAIHAFLGAFNEKTATILATAFNITPLTIQASTEGITTLSDKKCEAELNGLLLADVEDFLVEGASVNLSSDNNSHKRKNISPCMKKQYEEVCSKVINPHQVKEHDLVNEFARVGSTGNVHSLEELVRRPGVSLNARNINGDTPLMVLIRRSTPAMVQTFLQGAQEQGIILEVNAQDDQRNSAITLARELSNRAIIESLAQYIIDVPAACESNKKIRTAYR